MTTPVPNGTSSFYPDNPYYKKKCKNDFCNPFYKSECEDLEEAKKRIEEQANQATRSVIFNKCTATYGFTSARIGHSDIPCHEALDHIKALSRVYEGIYDINIGGLSVCRYNHYLPFLRRCQRQSGGVSLDTARKILESQIPKE